MLAGAVASARWNHIRRYLEKLRGIWFNSNAIVPANLPLPWGRTACQQPVRVRGATYDCGANRGKNKTSSSPFRQLLQTQPHIFFALKVIVVLVCGSSHDILSVINILSLLPSSLLRHNYHDPISFTTFNRSGEEEEVKKKKRRTKPFDSVNGA